MDCQEVRKFIQIYLDDEFDESDRRDLEEHLAGCPECRARADYERRFRQAIKARIPRPSTTEEFRQRLVRTMADQPEPRSLTRHLMWGSIPAVAALALVIIFTWTVTSGFSTLVDEAVTRHSSEPPVEVNSEDSDEVENWFHSKVDFNVALPRFNRRQLSLVGGRLSNLAKRQAAMISYRQGGRRFTLFVISDTDSGVDLGGQECRRDRQRELCLAEVRGYSVITWRSRGLLYSMVGDSATADLLRVLTSARSD